MSSSSSSSSSSNVSNQLDFFQSRKNLLYTAAGVSVSLFGLLYLYLQSKTDGLASDMSIIWKQIKLMKEVKSFGNNPNWNLAGHVIEQCKKHANKQALYYVDTNESYTFKEMDEISNQIANWVIEEGLRPGDVVGLIMDNRPEFIFTWLGLAKVGITCAFINHNLKAKPLIHSLTVCKAKHFIVGFEHADKGTYGMEQIGQNWYSYGGSVNGMKHLDSLLLSSPIKAPSSSHRKGHGPNSELIYIYTSGTTGNPKASIIKDLRYYSVAMAFVSTFDVNPNDRMYCSLPLYHSAGGMIGIGMMWFAGCTLVFRKKFSARNFWKDIREQNCTGFQYIGELCRYLLAQPETEYDNSNVRIAIGNGLRPDVWPEFQSRFNIQRIGEFYGATEGNAGLANYKGKVGAVGFTPRLVDPINPLKIVKFDVENEEIIRGENGFCIECGHDEAGELVGKIDQSDPLRAFHGYTDEKSTNNKILRDVFKKGDAYFRSGDLLKRDKTGYWYFVDRIGDTFRWKGENVYVNNYCIIAHMNT
eukprot:TRINITY_DN3077_c2_g1_i3.p1 TRINITY_DN3077_c2_g1~~TRINITY_DN3077_c2_g1_i3.p1  ORF type:complete len:529 (+),score=195.28 TRINITY_DN3077_c2_g1_i3:53-1639(+)